MVRETVTARVLACCRGYCGGQPPWRQCPHVCLARVCGVLPLVLPATAAFARGCSGSRPVALREWGATTDVVEDRGGPRSERPSFSVKTNSLERLVLSPLSQFIDTNPHNIQLRHRLLPPDSTHAHHKPRDMLHKLMPRLIHTTQPKTSPC
ncbi:RING-H2 finger protein ATL7 [Zea mays]|jgi:hypothetical protein|uniref:RING-H2 finger protein ATL7 n=1 Tax=Zea mays TaxID=4577 RepID=A0A1D6E2E7_MAIZE|nr:RING-H2 finger protein ATL7 [Zea mays]